jgi:hypothetical protein
MSKEEWKIVKEFEEPIDGYPYKIKARILELKSRSSTKSFYGTVSHYCKPSEQAFGVMRPQGQGSSIAIIERELKRYIKTFTSIGVEENDSFDQSKY